MACHSRSKLVNTAKCLKENELIDFLKNSLTSCNNEDKGNILNYITKLFDKTSNENTQDELKKLVISRAR